MADETDPGMEELPDGTLIIGNASQRAQIKKGAEEAAAYAQSQLDKMTTPDGPKGDAKVDE